MRLTFSLCIALSLTACGKYENERVTPASRQQLSFTYGERPMTLIWSGQTNTIVPRTNAKVLSNSDVAGIATITYETGPALLPGDMVTIISEFVGCDVALTAPGYGQEGRTRTASARIHCIPAT